jgi:type IV secretory pathway component VirB8
LTKTSLVATFYNFEELITSPNISTDFQKVRSAAKAIVNHSSKQMLENAFLYMARHAKSGNKYFTMGKKWQQVLSPKIN